jgi:hypothetical protein
MQLQLAYDYKSCIESSEKISWKLDEVFPEGTRLDFARPFLPEALAPTKSLSFLSVDERRALNQIAGNAYLNLFAFLEEYILATVLKHSYAEMFGDHVAIRALVRFADEEVKHQQLFTRYRKAFDRDFGHPCGVLESAVQVAGVVLSKSPIAILLLTLHIEHMTQQHYTECVRDDTSIDPLFAKLLKQHWLEESQHAKIDALELAKLVRDASAEQIKKGFEEYLELGGAVAGLLVEQAGLDVTSLEKKTGRTFTVDEKKAIEAQQLSGYKRTFLYYGMTNPQVQDIMRQMDAAMADKVRQVAETL